MRIERLNITVIGQPAFHNKINIFVISTDYSGNFFMPNRIKPAFVTLKEG